MMHREKNEAEGEEPTGEQEVGDKGRQVDGWEELEENTIQEGRMKND